MVSSCLARLLGLRPAQTQTRGLRPSRATTDQQPNAAKQGQRQRRRFGNGPEVNPDMGFGGPANPAQCDEQSDDARRES